MKLGLTNVSVIYGRGEPNETVGLPSVSLTLESGKPIVLTGPNGCGKTTLLKVLAGLLSPSVGKIVRDACDVGVTREWLRKNTVYLRQNPVAGVFSDLTLAENLAASLSNSGWFSPYLPTKSFLVSETKISNLVSFYTTHKGRRISDLSGGQQQLFAVACAGAESRSLILFDEPTSALDLEARARTEALLITVCQNPDLIAVIVTHDVGLASRIGFHSKRFEELVSHRQDSKGDASV